MTHPIEPQFSHAKVYTDFIENIIVSSDADDEPVMLMMSPNETTNIPSIMELVFPQQLRDFVDWLVDRGITTPTHNDVDDYMEHVNAKQKGTQ